MNHTETLAVVRLVKALCPGMKLDERTSDAWALVLSDVSFEDAREAVRVIYRDQGNPEEFGPRRIEADAILRQVRKVRRHRLEHFDPKALIPPPDMSVLQELQWHRDALASIANGEPMPTNTRGELKPRPIAALLAKSDHRV